jgi:hypothetical protein
MVGAGLLLVFLLAYSAWKIIVHLPQILMWIVTVMAGLFALKCVILIAVGVGQGIEASVTFLYTHGASIMLGIAMIAAAIAAIVVTCKYASQKNVAVVLPPVIPPTIPFVAPPRHPERVGYDHERDFYSG